MMGDDGMRVMGIRGCHQNLIRGKIKIIKIWIYTIKTIFFLDLKTRVGLPNFVVPILNEKVWKGSLTTIALKFDFEL